MDGNTQITGICEEMWIVSNGNISWLEAGNIIEIYVVENWGNLMEETKQYGYFQLIVQLMGVALHHSNEREVVDLFEWGDS